MWRIVEMDLWDRDAIDLVGPAFIRFDSHGTGDLRFIAVEGGHDHRQAGRGDRPRVEFSWEGNDEGDHASGRGWAQLDPDGSLSGHIFFHMGDDSGFRAVEDASMTSP
jgi:hypothetical protein